MTKKKSNKDKKQPWSIPLEVREELYNGINPSADFGIGSFLSQGIGYLGGFRTGKGMNEDEARWAAYLGLPYDKEYAPDTKIRFEHDKDYPDRQYQGLSKRAKNEIRKEVIPEAKRIKDEYGKEWIQVLDSRGTFGNDSTIYHPRETYTGDLGKFGIREVGNSGIYEVGDKYNFPSWVPVPDRNEGTELMIRDTIWSNRANPKLYNQEVIKRMNKFYDGGLKVEMPDFSNLKLEAPKLTGGLKSTISTLGNKIGGVLGSTLGGISGGIANTAATAIGGALAGGRTTGVGNALQGIGSLASNIPGVGGLIGAGVNLIGGGVNALFGSKLNAENIASVEGDIKQALNFTSNAGDYDALASNYAGLQGVMGFDKDFIGKDSWLGKKRAENKFNSLKKQAEEAEAHQLLALINNAQNIANTNLQLLEANYSAYGGPIDMKYTGVMSPFGNQFKDGGIYIKPSKRGTFTAAAKKRGMGVQEFASKVLANKEDYSPAMVKKANFAKNASKWKHADGGPLDTRMELLRRLEEKRNRRGTYGGGKHGGAGAGSLFLESPDDFTLVKDTVWVPYRETFNDAFGRARAAGLDEFMFDNKAYTTELGDNPNNNRAGEERVIEGLLPVERTRQVRNKKAEGGELFTNGVITIGNGGTHEDNPYEGVQMGVDPQGIPNLVEEGEVIYDDYVFSNRLRVPKEVRQKYKLRGVTFADAAKQLQKESEERPNDPISKKGLEASMKMLMSEHEMIRDKKENNKYAKGGRVNKCAEGSWLYKPVTSGFTPSKDDILAEMEAMYPSLLGESMLPIASKIEGSTAFKDQLGTKEEEQSYKVAPMKTSWLRYAPIVGAGLAVANDLFGGNEPDYSNANMFERAIEGTNRPVRARQIGNYLTYRPFDRDYYINKLNADTAAGRRASVNTSGGNRAAAMAGILASDYNYGNQLGALARQAEEYNLAQRQAIEQFNRGTNVTNAEMTMKADLANAEQAMQRARMYGSLAEYRDSILARNRAEKSANLTNFIQGLGDLGTELTDKDKLRWLADLGVLKYDDEGKYTGKKSNKTANGGRITRKKRGGFTI